MTDTAAVPALSGVALPGREGAWRVAFDGGRVAEITPEDSQPERLALPGFREPHCHADRAYLSGPRRPRSLDDAIAMTLEAREREDETDIAARAGRLLERASTRGATSLRTHVDVDGLVGLKAVRAVNAAREDLADRLDVEVVAFPGRTADPADPGISDLLRKALASGAEVLGGVPTLYERPARATEALLDLAAEYGVPVDLHLDETTDPQSSQLERVVELALERGLAGRLGLSHCCVLAALPDERLDRALGLLAEARATVSVQPALNLYLQDRRGEATPRLRGIAVVRELLAAGVDVRFGSDNVRDMFYPYGDADPLESAFLAAIAAHVEDESDLLAGICGGRRGIEEGDVADLVVLAARDLPEALATRPAERAVIRRGCLVAGELPGQAAPAGGA